VAVKGVDLQETVDDFTARWVAQVKLDMDPSLVTLRLVKRGAGKPTAKQEAKAKVLDDPSLSLAEAKVTGTAWLLLFVAGTDIERLSTRVDSPGARIMRTPRHPLTSRPCTVRQELDWLMRPSWCHPQRLLKYSSSASLSKLQSSYALFFWTRVWCLRSA
jgi:hypothetical protein